MFIVLPSFITSKPVAIVMDYCGLHRTGKEDDHVQVINISALIKLYFGAPSYKLRCDCCLETAVRKVDVDKVYKRFWKTGGNTQ